MNQEGYDEIQKAAFGSLVNEGVYDLAFQHSDPLRAFFETIFGKAAQSLSANGQFSVIDCGCGPGAWLSFAKEICEARGINNASFFGFDLTLEMVQVAAERVAGDIAAENLQQGDILNPGAYQFANHSDEFDIIFAYDVIQQLPRALQLPACETMAEHLSESGSLIIFDHDCRSKFGRVMGAKKFITQYFGLELVPRYFCNARYPKLAWIARQFENSRRFKAEIHSTPAIPKRALVVKRLK